MKKEGNFLVDVLRFCKDVLFPVFCVGCNAEGEWLCAECFPAIDAMGVFLCPVCAAPQPGGRCCDSSSSCQEQFLDAVVSIFPYTYGYNEQLLHMYKYEYATDVIDVFSSYCTSFFQTYTHTVIPPVDIIVPIPLHKRRYVERGFNQSIDISLLLRSFLCVPVVSGVYRNAHTMKQSQLKRVERFINMKSVFTVRDDFLATCRGKNILLVDDVFTTGATMQSCAQALRTAGVAHVYGCTLFRG